MTRVKTIGISAGVLVLLMLFTRPDGLPAAALSLPFILLFLTLFMMASVLLRKSDAQKTKRLKVSLLIAGFPTILLIMRSLGQLTIRDVLAMLALFSIGYFYIGRLSRQPVSQ